jgi:hypothetical protein
MERSLGPPGILTKKFGYELWYMRLIIRMDAHDTAIKNALEEGANVTQPRYDQARTILLSCISNDDLMSCFNKELPEIMQYLKKNYGGHPTSKCRKFTKDLKALKLEHGESINALFNRATELQRNLALIEQPQTNVSIVMAII